MMMYHVPCTMYGINIHATHVVLSMLTMLIYAPFLTKVIPRFCDVGYVVLTKYLLPSVPFLSFFCIIVNFSSKCSNTFSLMVI